MLTSHIRYRMADKQLSDISELMALAGVSRTAVNKLFHNEKLKTINLGTLIRLCDALDCSLSELVEYTPEKK